jgi:hypothetical protein
MVDVEMFHEIWKLAMFLCKFEFPQFLIDCFLKKLTKQIKIQLIGIFYFQGSIKYISYLQ